MTASPQFSFSVLCFLSHPINLENLWHGFLIIVYSKLTVNFRVGVHLNYGENGPGVRALLAYWGVLDSVTCCFIVCLIKIAKTSSEELIRIAAEDLISYF